VAVRKFAGMGAEIFGYHSCRDATGTDADVRASMFNESAAAGRWNRDG